ncbi:FadR/GntR family transcriptional regulator [Enterococcus sp. 5H]|uniref:FadR/GntR family transcriptional regulator n=1 Tax=Enterococcus sp. 5H TaxID=1229490 RepID=UPI0023041671|nr:FCD domain-containing protein [Enterococcus sp. 5H]MDA9469965.1 Transcriptional regulator, GntR family [Enterococcus sp. 5H]
MKNKNLVQVTIDQLKKYIQTENFKDGDKLLIEKQLAEKFGVGRSTLREAVKILEYGGVLEVKQGAGTFVKALEEGSNLRKDLIDVREMLETTAGKLACENRTEADLAALNQALFTRNRLLAKGNFSEYIQADLDFHLLIVKSSKNGFLIQWYQEIFTDLKTMLSTLVIDSIDYQDNTNLHQKMFDGILAQEPAVIVEAILENSRRK